MAVSCPIRCTINVDDYSEVLRTVGEKRLRAWAHYTLLKESSLFAQHVRENWLSGQALDVQSGETRASVHRWLSKDGRIYVRPGVGVPGCLNYLAKWTQNDGFKHEFMEPAFKEYFAGSRLENEISDNVDKMFRKTLGGI